MRVSAEMYLLPLQCKTVLVVLNPLSLGLNTLEKTMTLTVPNVITPNADGINDLLTIQSDDPLDIFNLNIYNRWGGKVFKATNQNDAWNGRMNNSDVAPESTIILFKLKLFAANLSKLVQYMC